MDTLDVKELIKELLTVNAPYLKSTFKKVKKIFEDKATLVYFRNKPLIFFHGKQTIGWESSTKSEILLCLYRLPVWIDNTLVFRCIERKCAFELRVYLNDTQAQKLGTFS